MFYSVALSHLLNELHAICRLKDVANLHAPTRDYTADTVVQFIMDSGTPHPHCIKIRNLFDRRNKNQVSHPGSDNQVAWAVTKNEYEEYLLHVGECLRYIL